MNLLEKFLNDYYSIALGVEPLKEDYHTTKKTAEYLLDNNYSFNETFDILRCIKKSCVTGEDLPNLLWVKSLLEKDTFYYSEIFHIKSKAPYWNPVTMQEECEKFYLEMKIVFTMDDLLSYYYDNCRVMPELRNEKKDKASLKYLINKYNKFKIPGIDYVIFMINAHSSCDVDKPDIYEVYDIERYASEAIQRYEVFYEEANHHKTNKIVWRS